MSVSVIQLIVDESTSKTITGQYEFTGSGTLLIPSGNAFPGTPTAKELFWRTDLTTLYRRDDGDTAWEAVSGGSALEVEDEGVSLSVAATKLNFAGAGVTVTEPTADEMLITIPGGGVGDQAAVVAVRTTNLALTGTYQELPFDTTEFENATAILEHDNTNTERVQIKETGAYKVTVITVVENLAAQDRTIDLELRVDGSPAQTLSIEVDKTAHSAITRETVATFTAGSYITTAWRDSAGGTDLTLHPRTVMILHRLTSSPVTAWVEDEFVPTLGQVSFIISKAPADSNTLTFSVNGVAADEGTQYTVSGTTITWLDTPYTLDTSDLVVVRFR